MAQPDVITRVLKYKRASRRRDQIDVIWEELDLLLLPLKMEEGHEPRYEVTSRS